MTERPIVEARGIKKHIPIRRGITLRVRGHVRAVDGVDLEVRQGETLGLVGESGSGKSTLGRLLLGLDQPTEGEVVFDGQQLQRLGGRDMRALRRRMQIIFQDPVGSLSARMTVEDIVGEGLAVHRVGDRAERRSRISNVLAQVGLPADAINRYPHQFSGGQRQRIGIARALAVGPDFIVADEPTSSLDVSVQAQVLNLMNDLKTDLRLSYLFIGHSLAVVTHVSDRLAVMYLGKIVEVAPVEEFLRRPAHPYSVTLLSAIPHVSPRERRERIILKGSVPSPVDPPPGCRFHTRCPIAREICADQEPPLRERAEGHVVACHFAGEMPMPVMPPAVRRPPLRTRGSAG